MDYAGQCIRLIALPGFVHKSEVSRVDSLLEIFQHSHGFKPYRVNYSTITRDENQIICHFNLNRYISDLDAIVRNQEFESPTAVFASSMGASIVGHYIAQHPYDHGITAYATVSPLPSWEQYANERIRERITQDKRNVPLTGKYDIQKGFTRYIPAEDIHEVQKANALAALAASPPTQKLKVLTFIGTQDEVTSLEKMRAYHAALGGTSENIKEYACGHGIPQESYQDALIAFFTENILRQKLVRSCVEA